MIDVNSTQLYAWLASFIWPFFRISALMLTAPILGHNAIPMLAKIGLAVLLTIMVGSVIPTPPATPIVSVAGLGLIIEQLLIGVAMGLCMRIVFATVQAAGEYIGMQMGLGFAVMYSADTGANSVIISRILHNIAIMMFLALSGHLLVVEILADTFTSLPIGQSTFDPSAGKLIAVYAKTIFSSGMLLALPMLTALLMMNLAMGILNRSAPQLTIFSIGFPMTLFVGIVLLMVMMLSYGSFLEGLFFNGITSLNEIVKAMRQP